MSPARCLCDGGNRLASQSWHRWLCCCCSLACACAGGRWRLVAGAPLSHVAWLALPLRIETSPRPCLAELPIAPMPMLCRCNRAETQYDPNFGTLTMVKQPVLQSDNFTPMSRPAACDLFYNFEDWTMGTVGWSVDQVPGADHVVPLEMSSALLSWAVPDRGVHCIACAWRPRSRELVTREIAGHHPLAALLVAVAVALVAVAAPFSCVMDSMHVSGCPCVPMIV